MIRLVLLASKIARILLAFFRRKKFSAINPDDWMDMYRTHSDLVANIFDYLDSLLYTF